LVKGRPSGLEIREGVPLCDAESVLSIRQATVEEDAAYKEGSSAAKADELPLVYLVALED
jgi:hypothetical protein